MFALPNHYEAETPWPQKNWPVGLRIAVQRVFGCKACSDVKARRVGLGTLGEGALLEQAETECGQGRNCFNFAVAYRYQGVYRADVVGGAAEFGVVKGMGPVPDLVGVDDVPCCEQIVTRSSFSGGRFVESGCVVAEYAGNFGDFKQAVTKACPAVRGER